MATVGAPAIEDLSASTCWSLLRQRAMGRIALHGANDEIEVFPVNYVVDHGSIVLATAQGTKVDLVRTGRRSTFEADDCGAHQGVAWSVVAKGTPAVVHRHDDLLATLDLEFHPWQPGNKPMLIRLVPDQITGRRFTVEQSPDLA